MKRRIVLDAEESQRVADTLVNWARFFAASPEDPQDPAAA